MDRNDRSKTITRDDDRRFAFGWAAAAVVLIALAPWASHLASWTPACPLKTLAGIPCPGCGTTRAALALADLDPLHALVRYPLPTLAWIAVLLGGPIAGALALAGRPLPRPRRLPTWAGVVIALLLLASWIYNVATGV